LNQHLLLVTEDGYGRRVPVHQLRKTDRRASGVRVSNTPVAIAMVVDDPVGDQPEAELVIATAGGKVQRVSVGSVPVRRRTDPSSGKVAKGARVIRLRAGDHVASGALIARVKVPATGTETEIRGKMQAAITGGESIGEIRVLHPLRELGSLRELASDGLSDQLVNGEMTLSRDEWVQSEVHARSSYWCSHCGRQHTDPHAVYACLDRHVDQHTGTLTAGR
jgi:DNA gyrase C-terminal domain, beta-propeller